MLTEALLASLMAGLATGLGALPFFFLRHIPHSVYDTLLGFAAGVMLAATAFSLIPPAWEMGGAGQTVAGVAAGVALLILLERVVPHLEPHFSPQATNLAARRMGILMALAITLHNFPEGLAVGVAYASGSTGLGLVIAIAIAVQNVPEGLAVAAPLRQGGVSRLRSILFATASGLAEPLAALIGLSFLSLAAPLAPFALAFAGGAMLYVVSSQLIPESHRHGHEKVATMGVAVGFLFMFLLQKGLT